LLFIFYEVLLPTHTFNGRSVFLGTKPPKKPNIFKRISPITFVPTDLVQPWGSPEEEEEEKKKKKKKEEE
jgi:hypothetical protein